MFNEHLQERGDDRVTFGDAYWSVGGRDDLRWLKSLNKVFRMGVLFNPLDKF